MNLAKILQTLPLCFATAVSLLSVSTAQAQNPPPGAIFDLANTSEHASGTPVSNYTQFTTSFVGDGSTEYVSFAFRDEPAYFSFDDASVTAAGSTTNLLQNPGFEQGSTTGPADIGKSVPDSWKYWMQAADNNGISQVASTSSGCGNPHSGTEFWCDGAVGGFDALYQAVSTTAGHTYNISFYLDEDSGDAIVNPDIDMLVYAGNAIPGGSGSSSGAPEPASVALLSGSVLVGVLLRRRKM